ncbi:hypothetical protein [Bifidobacterium sp. ESL0745]|uniref:hypothetical protein n=1 Tax=Bifidobacterium sp. ESL0745 TaxID=2983226 RepID=UPI0023F9C03F|nr:hypothetical protein [Bifidobacterium sp. ESL0745]MDF7665740.1 hypothetical protein [Bifidobacterium sp. ESL0745]
MANQYSDCCEAGIPPDVEGARHFTEVYKDEALASNHDQADDNTRQKADNRLSELTVAQLYRMVQAEAGKVMDWIHAGQGVSLGPEKPGVYRDGHIWLEESSVPRNPPYPSSETFPGPDTFPDREGRTADGRHVIVGIHRYDAATDSWTDFTLAPDLPSTPTPSSESEAAS